MTPHTPGLRRRAASLSSNAAAVAAASWVLLLSAAARGAAATTCPSNTLVSLAVNQSACLAWNASGSAGVAPCAPGSTGQVLLKSPAAVGASTLFVLQTPGLLCLGGSAVARSCADVAAAGSFLLLLLLLLLLLAAPLWRTFSPMGTLCRSMRTWSTGFKGARGRDACQRGTVRWFMMAALLSTCSAVWPPSPPPAQMAPTLISATGAAYSLRQFVPGYINAVVQLKHSNGSVADFYPTWDPNTGLYGLSLQGGGTLASWMGASAPSVNKWYDQSGNGRDLWPASWNATLNSAGLNNQASLVSNANAPGYSYAVQLTSSSGFTLPSETAFQAAWFNFYASSSMGNTGTLFSSYSQDLSFRMTSTANPFDFTNAVGVNSNDVLFQATTANNRGFPEPKP